ncbi:ABC transporter substrate-binding protein [Plebeiibacterium marinum]|uniref:ABC transporter substrate-binding protein n=1 Tax=Plebeiibacterium marinum TaxID=2992111 RepID=A0AAE3MGH7_9BACT|nr:ABC transporter substrate-binding protein [Plebeiobacterium marinum]MCW3807171.1 ABC transporter substrate-binding protein [Plebeiobacterium marinum]
MSWITRTFAIIALLHSLASCGRAPKNKAQNTLELAEVKLKYAKEFKIQKDSSLTRLTINTSSKDRSQKESFNLVSTYGATTHLENCIKVPCKKIICLSSTQLAYFFALDNIENISAINNSRFLYHEEMRTKVETGEVKQIGKEGNFNLEVIAAINPDVIFVSPFKRGGFDALRNLGIPLVPMAAYNEKTPLGRAEWIKMIALFCNNEHKADSLFNAIDSKYTHLKELTSNIKKRPTVFSGKMRSGSWYVPGGKSFYSHYFKDAGADYIIKDNHQGAYPVDFETMYKKASECDFWRIVHPEKKGLTLKDLAEQDSRYQDFKAFTNKNVLLCNIRQKPYYEQAAVKPDVILADYIHFFHPELLPEHTPCFYEKIE